MALWYEDFEVGSVVTTPARTVLEADIAMFAGLSGDYNPIHTDDEFAKQTEFGQRVAHGLLGLAIASGLSSRTGLLDGTVVAFLGMDEWRFLKPIKIGDTIRLRWTVTEKRLSSKIGRGVMKRKMEIVNQRNEVVQSGAFTTLIRCREKA
ncbi:MAG: MaoC/PaaZ C-terminal domain-containing protein [Roseiarcus sp.]